jgi:hypothetical protein
MAGRVVSKGLTSVWPMTAIGAPGPAAADVFASQAKQGWIAFPIRVRVIPHPCPSARAGRAPVADQLILPQAEALIPAAGADLRIGGNRAFYVPSADFYPGAAAFGLLRAGQLAPHSVS